MEGPKATSTYGAQSSQKGVVKVKTTPTVYRFILGDFRVSRARRKIMEQSRLGGLGATNKLH